MNQRVIHSNSYGEEFTSLEDVTRWMDSLIGNYEASDSSVVIDSIVGFQVMRFSGSEAWPATYEVIVVVNTRPL